jgi:hypothetical protein
MRLKTEGRYVGLRDSIPPIGFCSLLVRGVFQSVGQLSLSTLLKFVCYGAEKIYQSYGISECTPVTVVLG